MVRPGTNYYFAIFRIVKGNAVCNILYLRLGNCFHVLMKSFLLTPLMSESPISSVVFPYNSQDLFDVFVVSDATSDFSRVFSPLGVSHSSFFVAHWLDREVFISVSVATCLQRASRVVAICLICSGMSLHVIHGRIPTGVSFF